MRCHLECAARLSGDPSAEIVADAKTICRGFRQPSQRHHMGVAATGDGGNGLRQRTRRIVSRELDKSVESAWRSPRDRYGISIHSGCDIRDVGVGRHSHKQCKDEREGLFHLVSATGHRWTPVYFNLYFGSFHFFAKLFYNRFSCCLSLSGISLIFGSGVDVRVTVGVGDAVGDTVDDGVALGVAVGVEVLVIVGVFVTDGVGLSVTVGEYVKVSVIVGVGLSVKVWVIVSVGENVQVWVIEGVGLFVAVGE